MWAGPYNPTGSYRFPVNYGDGTPIYDIDFTTADWPDTGDNGERWIYGELELNEMTPPSASCMGAKLPSNDDVRTKLLNQYTSNAANILHKPVVCKGKLLLKYNTGQRVYLNNINQFSC